MVDVERIRAESIKAARNLGVSVLTTLPLLDSDVQVRGADQIVSRILAMSTVAAVAYGFDKVKAESWLNQEALTGSLTEQEGQFLFQSKGKPQQFQVQVEGIWALAWAVSIAPELNFRKECDDNFVMLL